MKRPRGPVLSILLVLASLGAWAGCRRVTIISFTPSGTPALEIDTLKVDFGSTKHPLSLGGFDEQIGLYNLPGNSIDIAAWACRHELIVLSNLGNGRDRQPYTIVSDTVVVTLGVNGDQGLPCPVIEEDGGVSGRPTRSGEGGATGAGGNTGAVGTGGMGEIGGAGGNGGAGAGGVTGCGGDSGDAAAGGTGGVVMGVGGGSGSGTGGCDDAGHGVDAGVCETPDPTTAAPPTDVAPSQACIDYCDQIIGPGDGGGPLCPGSYPDIATCQRYCTLVMWPAGIRGDHSDTLGCRQDALGMANGATGTLKASYCDQGGPSGGTNGKCGLADVCVPFCNALARICGRAMAGCLLACRTSAPPQPVCRYNWLLRAAWDQRYCDAVDISSTCSLPGC